MGRWVVREAGGGCSVAPEAENDNSRPILAFHSRLNVVLVACGPHLRAIDVNSGTILQNAIPGDKKTCVRIKYLPGVDRIAIWDDHTLGVRSDYNGVLLLHTSLQRPLQFQETIKIELFLSEVILLYQCMKAVDLSSVDDGLEVIKCFEDAIKTVNSSPRKGIKAQKWNTVCLELPPLPLKLVTNIIVQELKQKKQHTPALAIASALYEQVSDLTLPVSNPEQALSNNIRDHMYSEAMRKETFKKWPHMDYKWALPAQMAEAGFFYQPSVEGDDRVMCFICNVCLVCWEKTDEPWSEHERHSPDCSLVKGEYTHNVPLSVTYATSPAVSHPGISVVSFGNTGDIFVTGTSLGKVFIWNLDCKLKLEQEFIVSVDDPVIQNKLHGPYSAMRKAWENCNDNDICLNLTALSVAGYHQSNNYLSSKNASVNNTECIMQKRNSSKPSIICGVKFSSVTKNVDNIWNNSDKQLDCRNLSSEQMEFKLHTDNLKKGEQNNVKTESNALNTIYLIVYDFQSNYIQNVPLASNDPTHLKTDNGNKSGGSKKCENISSMLIQSDDGNPYADTSLPKYVCLDQLSQEITAELYDEVTLGWDGIFPGANKTVTTSINMMSNDNAATLKNIKKKFKTFIHPSIIVNNSLDNCVIHTIFEAHDTDIDQFNTEVPEKKPKSCLCESDSNSGVKCLNNNIILEKSDLNSLPYATDLIYEYNRNKSKTSLDELLKIDGLKTNIENTLDKENESTISSPVCKVLQCLELPLDIVSKNNLKVSYIVPTVDNEHILLVVTYEFMYNDSDAMACNEVKNVTEIDSLNAFLSNMHKDESEVYSNNYYDTLSSFLVLYALDFSSSVTLIKEDPLCIKEISYHKTPLDLCVLPHKENLSDSLGLIATIGYDGALRLFDVKTLEIVTEIKLDTINFVSVVFCNSIEKMCVCSESGYMYFYSINDSEENLTEEIDEDMHPYPLESNSEGFQHVSSENYEDSQQPLFADIFAHKPDIQKDDFHIFSQLIGSNTTITYSAVLPSCWCDLLAAQRSRNDNQYFYRSWRLQNTSSTWDEHVLELTLPCSSSVSHVDFKFSFHTPCSNPPNIQVTLLKQYSHSISNKNEPHKYFDCGSNQADDDLTDSELKDPLENPVISKEYLKAQNAEIVAGPFILAQHLDLSGQSGILTLTSPCLYRTKVRTLLLHLKTIFDPKDVQSGKIGSKKRQLSEDPGRILQCSTVGHSSGSAKSKTESYIGCDWLHEISITIHTNKHTNCPQEHLQRIAMIESDSFFEKLLNIFVDINNSECQMEALDLLIWIASIRLGRFRNIKPEFTKSVSNCNKVYEKKSKYLNHYKNEIGKIQQRTITSIQDIITVLITKCILLSNRSIAKKCTKLILICCKGAKNMNDDISNKFEMVLLNALSICLPLIGSIQSAGSLFWFSQLVMRSLSFDAEMKCIEICVQLLKEIASIMKNIYNPYHSLLRSRFGLYGLPMESSIFNIDPPTVSKPSSSPLTSSLLIGVENINWWHNEFCVTNRITGLSEVIPLHLIYHSSSDGTNLDTPPNQQSYQPFYPINSENPQLACDMAIGGTNVPWETIVRQPQQQTFVVRRMQPGTRHFVILDFGYPIKLTDLMIPACSDILTMSIDVWLISEDENCTKLVVTQDISTKNLIMNDIQPPPLCRFIKITVTGKYNISTARCKVPLGFYYGEIADSAILSQQHNIGILNNLHQDLTCKFRLAVGKLTDSLNFYLQTFDLNFSHSGDMKNENDRFPGIKLIYQECLELKQQMMSVEKIIEKFLIKHNQHENNSLLQRLEGRTSNELLKDSSLDKLKFICEQLTDTLLYALHESGVMVSRKPTFEMDVSTCSLITRWLIVCCCGSPRLEAGLACVLVKLCSSQSWWGGFIADTIAQLYNPSNTLMFSQNRILTLLIYMGHKSLHANKSGNGNDQSSSVIASVSKLVIHILSSLNGTYSSNMSSLWQTTDLTLLGWSLMYLSASLDFIQPNSGLTNSWLRWNFLSGISGNTLMNVSNSNPFPAKSSSASNLNQFDRRKLYKRLIHKTNSEEFEKFRKILQGSHQKFEDFIYTKLSSLNKRAEGFTSSGQKCNENEPGLNLDIPTLEQSHCNIISQNLALQVIQSLISLILSMDFACNNDILLLTCKVIGRLSSICGGFSTIIKEHDLLNLMRVTCSQIQWQQYALLMLLQDLTEYHHSEYKMNDIYFSPSTNMQTDAESDKPQWCDSTSNSNSSKVTKSDMKASTTIFNKNKNTKPPLNELLIESDEDFDMSDSIDEDIKKIIIRRMITKVSTPKVDHGVLMNSSSSAVDARLHSGLEISGELSLRKLFLLGGGALASAIISKPKPSTPVVDSASTTEYACSSSSVDLINMLKKCFHILFTELESQGDALQIECVLQLWITLNGCNDGKNSNKNLPNESLFSPKIKLSSYAVISLIRSVNRQVVLSLKCWVMVFQCLSRAFSCPNESDTKEFCSSDRMAVIMLKEPQFVEIVVKFLSNSMDNFLVNNGDEKPYAGPFVCATFNCLLRRLSCLAPSLAKSVFLNALCKLSEPGGAFYNGRGLFDAQRDILHIVTLNSKQYNSSHLPEAMSLIENIGIIIHSLNGSFDLENNNVSELVSNINSVDFNGVMIGLGDLLTEVYKVSSENLKKEKPTSRREILISLVTFATTLILTPLRDTELDNEAESHIEASKTDECKASQKNIHTNFSTRKIACLADTVLQHYPTMGRIFKSLSVYSTSKVLYSNNPIFGVEMDIDEPVSFGDILLKFVVTLTHTASHPKIILPPLLEYLERGALSDILIKFTINLLENNEALEEFIFYGGLEIICTRLILTYKRQLNPQSGLIASLINYLKNTQISNLSSTNSSVSDKKPSSEDSAGLFNFAPLGTIKSENPSAQDADVLLMAPNISTVNGNNSNSNGGAHRRTRTAAWSHHFCHGETSIDLCVKLPTPILLHEVQLQPHLSALASCPSAVGLEVSTHGSVITPLGSPQFTAGMTHIKLKLIKPQVVSTLLIRLYKPTDSYNISLLNIKILGTSAPVILPLDKGEKNSADNRTSFYESNSSAGWTLILWKCLRDSENDLNIKARHVISHVNGLSEVITGLLVSRSAPPDTCKMLLYILGSEPSTSLHVLSLILRNSHIHKNDGYIYPRVFTTNCKSPTESICELLYRLCTLQDSLSFSRFSLFINWLKEYGALSLNEKCDNFLAPKPYISPEYVQCLASVLWFAKENMKFDWQALITLELFEIIYNWIEILPAYSSIKLALNSVLCSLCYIHPELFTKLLTRMGITVPNPGYWSMNYTPISDDRRKLQDQTSMTDDNKVHREHIKLECFHLSASQLMTIAAACMSRTAIKILLESNLLINITNAIQEFCVSLNDERTKECDIYFKRDSETSRADKIIAFIECLTSLCFDAELKDWLGGPNGSCFWKSILISLCLPSDKTRIWCKTETFVQLEEKTIKYFRAVTSHHISNQKLFSNILYDVIKHHADVVTGAKALQNQSINSFTKRLFLCLFLRNDRVSIAMNIQNENECHGELINSILNAKSTLNESLLPQYLTSHPSLYNYILLSLTNQSNFLDIISKDVILSENTNATNSSSTNPSKKSLKFFKTVDNDQGSNAVETWELSVAAANTAKDKRTKEARNLCTKRVIMQYKKRNVNIELSKSIKNNTSEDSSSVNDTSLKGSVQHNDMKLYIEDLDQYISPDVNFAKLCSVVPHKFGTDLKINVITSHNQEMSGLSEILWSSDTQLNLSILSIFTEIGGFTLLAHHIPPICTSSFSVQNNKSPSSTHCDDWVKLDDIYEDAVEATIHHPNEDCFTLIPTHSLIMLGLFLRIPGYAKVLLKEGHKAVCLLRLLFGAIDDGEGREISSTCDSGLGTLSFRILGSILEASPLSTDDGMLLRFNLWRSGALGLLLVCLAAFTHQQLDSSVEANASNNGNPKKKTEEKNKHYWAKGTGFGTGSTQQSWNVEESLVKQKIEEEHIIELFQVIASFLHPREVWHIKQNSEEESIQIMPMTQKMNPNLPSYIFNIFQNSVLLSVISSYLRNDSVLDMSRHIPLYLAVMKVVRAITFFQIQLIQNSGNSNMVFFPLSDVLILLQQMSHTVDIYAKKLQMNNKSMPNDVASNNLEEDEGLALLIADIQSTFSLLENRLEVIGIHKVSLSTKISHSPSLASRETRYLEIMKKLQFETFEMIGECSENVYKFNVSYHFESAVRSAGEHSHPARMKRLAQEAVTLSTSLPLSYSSSVFVRTDQDRLDVMKVLITGPSDTPYANGCFEFDVYFPVDYPNTPMLINLETTGKHSVRFNPNLYLDGKVCLSVLNTWHGRPEEQWNPQTSSLLQVLVSIQSLILVPEPYFNEPGFERSRGTPTGTNNSVEYNSNIYQACVRWAMLEQLRNPVPCFRQVIQTHFWLKRDEICCVIENWIKELEHQITGKRTQINIELNLIALQRHYKSLREELAKLTVPSGLEELETPFPVNLDIKASSTPPSLPISDENQTQDMEIDMDHLIKTMTSHICE